MMGTNWCQSDCMHFHATATGGRVDTLSYLLGLPATRVSCISATHPEDPHGAKPAVGAAAVDARARLALDHSHFQQNGTVR